MLNTRRPLRYCLVAAGLLALIYLHNGISSPQIFPHGSIRRVSITKSSFDWGSLRPQYPVSYVIPLPTGSPRRLPRIQHDFPPTSQSDLAEQESRQQAVKKTVQKCWQSYKKHAWMKDELRPISGRGKNTFGGWAATLIDSLDTLWIMGLKAEFNEAVDAVAALDWASTTATSCMMFETTIRHLGGLLAAYDLSREQALLNKAVELGDMLYAGFDTPNRMPGFWLDFERAKTGEQIAGIHESSASTGSLCMEFTRLSQLTGNPKYYDAVARVMVLYEKNQNSTKLPGMWPTFVNMQDGIFSAESTFTLGALADSLYEYLPKMYALLGGLQASYGIMWSTAAETISKNMLFRPMVPDNADILFPGDVKVDGAAILTAESQHLSCFVGGMFALGGRLFNREDHIELGTKLTRGCIWAYNAFPTGVAPEIFNLFACDSLSNCEWDEKRWERYGDQRLPKGIKNARDPSYILRPEAMESVFVLYRITGLKEFQDSAWQMFQSIQQATETEYGNAAIDDVTVIGPPKKRDSMEVRFVYP